MKLAKQVPPIKGRAAPKTARARSDAGAAALEFVLVLPILLALVFGIIFFGYIFAAQISLNSSARDAARAGVVQPIVSGTTETCTQIANAARLGAVTIGVAADGLPIGVTVVGPAGKCTLPSGSSTVTLSPTTLTTPCLGSNVGGVDPQLTVSLTFTAVSPVPLMPLNSVDLKAKGGFQCEYS